MNSATCEAQYQKVGRGDRGSFVLVNELGYEVCACVCVLVAVKYRQLKR